jgi:hypothetical protein
MPQSVSDQACKLAACSLHLDNHTCAVTYSAARKPISVAHMRLLHAQLPALERLDLVLDPDHPLDDPEHPPTDNDAKSLGSLQHLGALTALTLRAGPMHGLLHYLRLPPDLKAGLCSF